MRCVLFVIPIAMLSTTALASSLWEFEKKRKSVSLVTKRRVIGGGTYIEGKIITVIIVNHRSASFFFMKYYEAISRSQAIMFPKPPTHIRVLSDNPGESFSKAEFIDLPGVWSNTGNRSSPIFYLYGINRRKFIRFELRHKKFSFKVMGVPEALDGHQLFFYDIDLTTFNRAWRQSKMRL